MFPIKWKSGLVFFMLLRTKLINFVRVIRYSSEKLTFLNRYSWRTIIPHLSLTKHCANFCALSSHLTKENENSDECETCFFEIPYMGPASKQFTKNLSEFV